MAYNFARISFFRPPLKPFFLITLVWLLSGCAHYKEGTHRCFEALPRRGDGYESFRCPWLYRVVPRHRCQIKGYDVGHWCTWLFFGNDDDGIFGECAKKPYRPDQKNDVSKAIRWWLRNPLHNFTFYAIGSAYCINSECILLRFGDRKAELFHYNPVARHNFGGSGTSFLLALHGWKPYISLRLQYSGKHFGEFYFGWRQRGNFGMKLQPLKKKK